MNESSAWVKFRDGRTLDLSMSLSNEDGQSQLAKFFPDHQVTLVPGSRNDLFQAMDNLTVMLKQRRLKFEFEEDEYQKLKQQQLKAADPDSGDDTG